MDLYACQTRLQFIENGNLDENSEKSEKCDGFKLELKEHQRSMLYQLNNLESGDIKISTDNGCDVLHSQIGIIADSTGAGKSIEILAHLTKSPIHEPNERVTVQFGNFLYVKSSYTKKMYLKSNLIVVPHSCAIQWMNYIKTHTDLPHTMISKRKEIEQFSTTHHQEQRGIVLCTSSMYNDFLDYHEVRWNRVIFDEADTINIPACKTPDAYFVWFLTSSLHNLLFPSGYYFVKSRIPGGGNQYMISRKYIDGIRKIGFIRDTFRVLENNRANIILKKIIFKNNDEYVKASFSLPEPIINIVTCKTPGYVRILLGNVGNDIINMLNAGNIEGAIERVGFSVDTHANIVSSVTQSLETKLYNISKELEYVQSLSYNNEREMENVNKRAEGLMKKQIEIKETIKCIKERIMENEGTCPLCYDEYTKQTILGCCQNAMCFECITRSLQIQPRCPMCRTTLKPEDITIIGEKCNEVKTIPTKEEALMNIINNNPSGKYLIFSGHDESFYYIDKVLENSNKKYLKLLGSLHRVNNILTKYKEGDLDVLMLNATHYGTGLNLENTTDLIFYHKMSQDMEKQVIGRAQRSGRTSNLNIHYLYQANELK